MFVPFYSTVFLAFESGNVIGLRMMKTMSGGSASHAEAHLMVMEKVHAMFEAGASLLVGGTASSVVDRTGITSPQTRNDYHARFYAVATGRAAPMIRAGTIR